MKAENSQARVYLFSIEVKPRGPTPSPTSRARIKLIATAPYTTHDLAHDEAPLASKVGGMEEQDAGSAPLEATP